MSGENSWYSGFFNPEQDVFSQLVGGYLNYEKIQHQADASGQGQQVVNQKPENSQNVQQPMPAMPPPEKQLIDGVPNAYLILGGVGALVAVIALTK